MLLLNTGRAGDLARLNLSDKASTGFNNGASSAWLPDLLPVLILMIMFSENVTTNSS